MLRALVKETIEKQNLLPKQRILLGVSGGADSMVLLDILAGLREEMGFGLGAAHVDHGIREDSPEDAALVKRFCQERNIACYQTSLAILEQLPQGENLENYARQQRYRFFRQVMEEEGFDLLMTAHHAQDQAETVLLHILRGCGSHGLCGMQERAGDLCRPMLRASKEQIYEYAKMQGIPFREDHTNADCRYTRNRIRHELIPLLKSYNPNIVESLCNMASQVAQDAGYLDQLAAMEYKKVKKAEFDGAILLDFPGMLLQNPAIQYRIFKCALYALGIQDMDSDMIARCIKAMDSHRLTDVGREIFVQARHGWIEVFYRKRYSQEYDVALGEQIFPAGQGIAFSSKQCEPQEALAATGRFAQAFDADILMQQYAPLTLRTRRTGDQFLPYAGKRKSLSDFMTDEKIPTSLRDRIFLLAWGKEILWVPGYRRGNQARITEKTRQAVLFEYKALF